MTKIAWYIIIAIIVIAVVVVLLVRGGSEEVSVSPTPTSTATVSLSTSPTGSVTTSPTTTTSATPNRTPTTTPTRTPSTVTVNYTAGGFAPNTVTIKAGDTVVFRNNSSTNMWPASAMHPTHDKYPEKGTCFTTVFTGCEIAPGGTFTMKFNSVGSWAYHDHLSPSKFGTIVVTQ